MEVSKKCMVPFQGQMSVGEFREDASEFQVRGISSVKMRPDLALAWRIMIHLPSISATNPPTAPASIASVLRPRALA